MQTHFERVHSGTNQTRRSSRLPAPRVDIPSQGRRLKPARTGSYPAL